MYPLSGVMVKGYVAPSFTVCTVLGFMVPLPAFEGVTVQVVVLARFAWQLAFIPFVPSQVQVQGPVPVT
jgi:hypothetical protein